MSNLALRIAGTKQRQAGFAPLVNIGILPEGEGQKMYRSPLVNENPVIVVKHTTTYILYLLIDCKVKAFDAAPSGALSIAIAIPREMQLTEGKSPYSLLMEVYECFRAENMTPMNDGRYCFIDQEADDQPYRLILEKYPLEPRKGSFIEMSPSGPTGIVCVPQQHLEAFFKDTQYQEFRSYRDIEVGVACQPSPGLDLLEIPRITRYAVVLNGTRTNRALAYPEDRFESDLMNTATVEYGKVAFSLQELLDAPGGIISQDGGTVRLDEMKSAIYCDVRKTEIHYLLQVEMEDTPAEGREALLRGIRENRLALKLGGKDITTCLVGTGTQIISANDVNQRVGFTISSFGGYRMLANSSLDRENRKLSVRISYQKMEVVSVSDPNRPPYNPSGGGPGTPKQPKPFAQPRPEPPVMVPPRKQGINWLSLAIGAVVGLLIGGGAMYLLMSQSRGDDVDGDGDRTISVKYYNQLKTKEAELDQLRSQRDSLQDALNDLKNKYNESVDGLVNSTSQLTTPQRQPSTPPVKQNQPSTKPNNEDAKQLILNAINEGRSYAEIAKMPGFSTLKGRTAIQWLLDYDNLLKADENGNFKGDSRKAYSREKEQAARSTIRDWKNQHNGEWTWELLTSFQTAVGKAYSK